MSRECDCGAMVRSVVVASFVMVLGIVGSGCGGSDDDPVVGDPDAKAPPQISVVADDAFIMKSGGTSAFTLELDKVTTENIDVEYTLAGTAELNADYTTTPASVRTVTIPAGSTTASVAIKAVDNGQADGNTTVVLILTNSSQYKITSGLGAATIQIREGTVDLSPEITAGPTASPSTITLPTDIVKLSVTAIGSETLTYTWSDMGDTGNVTFNNAASPITYARFTTAGTYNLQVEVRNDVSFDTATVEVMVKATIGGNNAPTTESQSLMTNVDAPKAITLVASDLDNGDTLDYSIVNPPTHGTLSGTEPNLTYTPETGFTGADSFTFRVNDGTVDSNTATVNITIVAEGAFAIIMTEPVNGAIVPANEPFTLKAEVSDSTDIAFVNWMIKDMTGAAAMDNAGELNIYEGVVKDTHLPAEGGIYEITVNAWGPKGADGKFPRLGQETITVTTSSSTGSPQLSVVADDVYIMENGGTSRFTISLNEPVEASLNIPFTLSGSADVDTDYRVTAPALMEVTIFAGSSTAEVNIEAIDDSIPEGTQTVVIELQTSPDYTLTTPSATMAILEQRVTGPPQVSVIASNESLTEGGFSGKFIIQLDRTSQDALDIPFTLSGSATRNTDYSTADITSTVTVPAGVTRASVSIVPLEDEEYSEVAENVILTLNDESVGYTLKIPEATIVIQPISSQGTTYEIATQADFDNHKNNTVFQSGDRILFKRDVTFYGMFEASGEGTAEAPIRMGAYGAGERPVIDAQGEKQAALLLHNISFWEVDGLELTNPYVNENGYVKIPNQNGVPGHATRAEVKIFGIFVRIDATEDKTYEHIYINDCHVHDVNDMVGEKEHGGIHVHMKGNSNSIIDDLRITNNIVENVGGVGIANRSENAGVFQGNQVMPRNLWTNVYVADNVVDRTGRNTIIARVSRDAIYERNVLANSSRADTGHNIFSFNTVGIKIQYNEAYGNTGAGGDRGGFDADYNCSNTYIQYNYSHDNEWFCGIMKLLQRNVYIRYNLSVNEGAYYYGFNNQDGNKPEDRWNELASDIFIYNNTHYVPEDRIDTELFDGNSTPFSTTFKNNIFYFAGGGIYNDNDEDGFLGEEGRNTFFDNNIYVNIDPYVSDTDPDKSHRNPQAPEDLDFVNPPSEVPLRIDLHTMGALSGYALKDSSPYYQIGANIIADPDGKLEKQNILGEELPDSRRYGAF